MDICTSLDMTKGALYFYFTSKEELAAAIIDEQRSIVASSLNAIDESAASSVEKIVMATHELARLLSSNPLVRAGTRLSDDASTGRNQRLDDWLAWFEHQTQRAVNDGEIVTELEPSALARFLLSSFTGVSVVSTLTTRRADLHQRLDEMWAVLFPAILEPALRDRADEIRQVRYRQVGRRKRAQLAVVQ